jgi:hypothetical protein
MFRRVALVRTDVSEKLSVSIRVTGIGELGTILVTASVVPSSRILVTLMTDALSSSETSILQEPHGGTSQKTAFFDGILHSHILGNLKSYKTLS